MKTPLLLVLLALVACGGTIDPDESGADLPDLELEEGAGGAGGGSGPGAPGRAPAGAGSITEGEGGGDVAPPTCEDGLCSQCEPFEAPGICSSRALKCSGGVVPTPCNPMGNGAFCCACLPGVSCF